MAGRSFTRAVMPNRRAPPLVPADETRPFISFSAVRQNEPGSPLTPCSRSPALAGDLAALLADLGDVLGQLIVKIVRRARDDVVADEVKRRALQSELVGKLLGLIERLLDLRVLHVLFELRRIETELGRDAHGFVFVGFAGLGKQLLMHLEIFALFG